MANLWDLGNCRPFITPSHRLRLARSTFYIWGIALVVGSLLASDIGCGTGRISGTYIAHGPDFASMLQLTQTDSNHVTGALDEIELGRDGRIRSSRYSITGGAFDGDQLTLEIPFHENTVGSIKWNSIQLHGVGSNGAALSWDFEHGSPERFKAYADELRRDGDGIALSANLARRTQEIRQTIQNAEKWISFADLHAQRIPSVKDYYRKVEDQMRTLIEREHTTSNSVTRSQISVRVIQGNVEAMQADLQVDQMWDRTIGDAGRDINNRFATFPSACGIRKELLKRRATTQAVDAWESACEQARAERTRFEPVFKRVTQQRAELKSFQIAAESHRQALVDEASRIQ